MFDNYLKKCLQLAEQSKKKLSFFRKTRINLTVHIKLKKKSLTDFKYSLSLTYFHKFFLYSIFFSKNITVIRSESVKQFWKKKIILASI